MSQTVQWSINTANHLANLKFAFTTSVSVMAELMQNARRAGASQVAIDVDSDSSDVCVTDDGGGIRDFQTLLTLSESGWDAEVMTQDKPFGLGFFSALCSAARDPIH